MSGNSSAHASKPSNKWWMSRGERSTLGDPKMEDGDPKMGLWGDDGVNKSAKKSSVNVSLRVEGAMRRGRFAQ